ncbi:UDP-N-acetylglucosamine transferase subunit ALG13 homolog [Coccinella septempunctata]|uniref:UDP-N-acetylglucosamine transferase subunit ALG13 homolog n=1 Tax=Coccinella septempunctata TaxID=41139 RepID=UPI001D07160D|nr:UDP-N-acetylglucosamine transferase subunit ALG13 homolog [Coccinella septempunctata]
MDKKHLFVTVGTTNFNRLITTLTSETVLNTLTKLGYKSIQFQTGTADFTKVSNESIEIMYENFFEEFVEQIRKSDLVISHAGAGSCLEVLQCEKPLIVVINEDLMDNHQIELAEHLSKQGHLYYCTCETLEETLLKDLKSLKPYPKIDENTFGNYLNGIMRLQKPPAQMN